MARQMPSALRCCRVIASTGSGLLGQGSGAPQATLSGPQSSSSSSRAAESSRRRPCSTSSSTRLVGGGVSRRLMAARSASICCRPLISSHWPRPMAGLAAGLVAGRWEALPAAAASTRPPVSRVARAASNSWGSGDSRIPAAGSCSRASPPRPWAAGSRSSTGAGCQRSCRRSNSSARRPPLRSPLLACQITSWGSPCSCSGRSATQYSPA